MQTLAITWLGHSAFRVRTPGGKELLFDPWYTGNPSFPQAARPKSADLILVSHGHSDHITDAAAMAKQTGATVVGTAIVNRIAKGESDIPGLVAAIYANLDPRLVKAAGMSVLAHLEDLVARGAVSTDGPPSMSLPIATSSASAAADCMRAASS